MCTDGGHAYAENRHVCTGGFRYRAGLGESAAEAGSRPVASLLELVFGKEDVCGYSGSIPV
jgi:hypothetical protein